MTNTTRLDAFQINVFSAGLASVALLAAAQCVTHRLSPTEDVRLRKAMRDFRAVAVERQTLSLSPGVLMSAGDARARLEDVCHRIVRRYA